MIRIGILRGGPSDRYDASLKTGAYLLRNLPKDVFEPVDIFIDKEGTWHMHGRTLGPDKLKHYVDIVWNALHGFYGEDGKVQQFLESHNIPFVGTGSLSSALVANRKMKKEYLEKAGVLVSPQIYVEEWATSDPLTEAEKVAREVSLKMAPPWTVKAISLGHTANELQCKTRDELVTALTLMAEHQIPVLVEQVVFGTSSSVFTVKGFRGKKDYALLPVYGKGRLLPSKDRVLIEELVQKIQNTFDLGHYAHIHGVITKNGKVYLSKIETSPELHEESPLHDMLSHVGSNFSEFAKHVVKEAMGK